MPGLYAVARSFERGDVEYVLVADNDHLEYVARNNKISKNLNERIPYLVEQFGKPSAALDWILLGTRNQQVMIGEPRRAVDFDDAQEAAREALRESDPNRSYYRQDDLAYIASVYDEWVETFPEMDPDDPTPEQQLEYELLLAGGVDPELPHRWLPGDLGDTACFFCDKTEDDGIHNMEILWQTA